jgi:FMN phosphatase YigB (HAD superfamily)
MNALYRKITSQGKPEDGFISFDVFDTLVTRIFTATEVLEGLSRYILFLYNIPRSKENVDLALKLRSDAWNVLLLDKRKLQPDIEDALSIEMIPQWLELLSIHFNTGIGIRRDDIKKIADFELNLELFSIKPVEEFLELTKKLKKDGFKLMFISDMYLSSIDITRILRNCGYEDIFEISYSSGETGFLKRSGEIFKRLLNEGTLINIHIGDDEVADGIKPRNCGIRSIHYVAQEVKKSKRIAKKNQAITSRLNSLRANQLNDIIVEKMQTKNLSTSADVQIISNFIISIAQILSERENPTILPAREGLVIGAGLYEVEDIFGTFNLHYAPFSRNAVVPVLLKRNLIEFLKSIIENNPEASWIDVCNFLRIPHLEGVQIAKQNGLVNILETIDLSATQQIFTRIARDSDFEKYWEAAVAKKERQISKWLTENIGKTTNMNFIDLGWKGTIQSNIAAVINKDQHIFGLYFGLKVESKELSYNDASYNSMVAYPNRDFASHVILDVPQYLELSALAPHETVKSVDAEIVDIDSIKTHLEQNPTEKSRITSHVNIMKYLQLLKYGHWILNPSRDDYRKFSATLGASALIFPQRETAKQLELYETDFGLDSQKKYRLIVPGRNLNSLRLSHWKVGSSFISAGRIASIFVFLRHQLRWNVNNTTPPELQMYPNSTSNPVQTDSSGIFRDYHDLLGSYVPRQGTAYKAKFIKLRIVMILANILRSIKKLPRFENYCIPTRDQIIFKTLRIL